MSGEPPDTQARLRFEPTPIAGLWLVRSLPVADERGEFTRLYCAEEFDRLVPGLRFVQFNQSLTRRSGTIRGLHLQRDGACGEREHKLVRCLQGRVFDVAADLRPDSPSYGRCFTVQLSARSHRALLIPPGVAHGFQALSDRVLMCYQHSAAYDAALQGGVRHDDPRLGIAWPLPVGAISARDRQLPGFAPQEARATA